MTKNAAFPQGNNNGSSTLSLQASSQNENTESHVQQDQNFGKQEQRSSLMELERSVPENQQQHNSAPLHVSKNQPQADREQGEAEQVSAQFSQTAGLQVSEKAPILVNDPNRMQNRDNESQYMKLQKMSNQQAMVSEQANNPLNRSKQVPFASLMPVLMPQLDKDRGMQLQTLFTRLKVSNKVEVHSVIPYSCQSTCIFFFFVCFFKKYSIIISLSRAIEPWKITYCYANVL